jgi:hypothetical protein
VLLGETENENLKLSLCPAAQPLEGQVLGELRASSSVDAIISPTEWNNKATKMIINIEKNQYCFRIGIFGS